MVGQHIMGMELPKEESHEMEDADISDLELVYHVREALTAVQSVSKNDT